MLTSSCHVWSAVLRKKGGTAVWAHCEVRKAISLPLKIRTRVLRAGTRGHRMQCYYSDPYRTWHKPTSRCTVIKTVMEGTLYSLYECMFENLIFYLKDTGIIVILPQKERMSTHISRILSQCHILVLWRVEEGDTSRLPPAAQPMTVTQ